MLPELAGALKYLVKKPKQELSFSCMERDLQKKAISQVFE